jgi:hypothetical protein
LGPTISDQGESPRIRNGEPAFVTSFPEFIARGKISAAPVIKVNVPEYAELPLPFVDLILK